MPICVDFTATDEYTDVEFSCFSSQVPICVDFTATDEYTDVEFSCFSSQVPICVDFTATDVQLQEYPLPRKSFT